MKYWIDYDLLRIVPVCLADDGIHYYHDENHKRIPLSMVYEYQLDAEITLYNYLKHRTLQSLKNVKETLSINDKTNNKKLLNDFLKNT